VVTAGWIGCRLLMTFAHRRRAGLFSGVLQTGKSLCLRPRGSQRRLGR